MVWGLLALRNLCLMYAERLPAPSPVWLWCRGASAVRNLETLDCKAIANLDEAAGMTFTQSKVATFRQALERDESNTVFLVR